MVTFVQVIAPKALMLAQNLNIGNPETLLQTLDMFSLVLKDQIWSQSGFNFYSYIFPLQYLL